MNNALLFLLLLLSYFCLLVLFGFFFVCFPVLFFVVCFSFERDFYLITGCFLHIFYLGVKMNL